MIKGKIHSIETMGLVDGPGIRTVFFLQGCPLNCSYCHNPDTQDFFGGKSMTPDEIVEMSKRYLPYYRKSGGGVTFSGGEPLVQGEFLLETLKRFEKEDVCTVIDTCGFGPDKYLEDIVKNVSYVILDIKHYDEEKHIALTGRSMKGREKFMKLLKKYNKRLLIRHVMVPGYTDDYESMDKIYEQIKFLSKTIEKIEILPYHKHGVDKYSHLGMEYKLKDVPEMDPEKAQVYQEYINELHHKDLEKEEILEA